MAQSHAEPSQEDKPELSLSKTEAHVVRTILNFKLPDNDEFVDTSLHKNRELAHMMARLGNDSLLKSGNVLISGKRNEVNVHITSKQSQEMKWCTGYIYKSSPRRVTSCDFIVIGASLQDCTTLPANTLSKRGALLLLTRTLHEQFADVTRSMLKKEGGDDRIEVVSINNAEKLEDAIRRLAPCPNIILGAGAEELDKYTGSREATVNAIMELAADELTLCTIYTPDSELHTFSSYECRRRNNKRGLEKILQLVALRATERLMQPVNYEHASAIRIRTEMGAVDLARVIQSTHDAAERLGTGSGYLYSLWRDHEKEASNFTALMLESESMSWLSSRLPGTTGGFLSHPRGLTNEFSRLLASGTWAAKGKDDGVRFALMIDGDELCMKRRDNNAIIVRLARKWSLKAIFDVEVAAEFSSLLDVFYLGRDLHTLSKVSKLSHVTRDNVFMTLLKQLGVTIRELVKIQDYRKLEQLTLSNIYDGIIFVDLSAKPIMEREKGGGLAKIPREMYWKHISERTIDLRAVQASPDKVSFVPTNWVLDLGDALGMGYRGPGIYRVFTSYEREEHRIIKLQHRLDKSEPNRLQGITEILKNRDMPDSQSLIKKLKELSEESKRFQYSTTETKRKAEKSRDRAGKVENALSMIRHLFDSS